MISPFLKDSLGWGFILWLIGYVLGIVLFPVVPAPLLGWVISPIGVAITLFVLCKKVKGATIGYYIGVGVVWAIMAVVLDYLLLVKLFNPPDGYYKPDVFLYYGLTGALPVIVGWWKTRKQTPAI